MNNLPKEWYVIQNEKKITPVIEYLNKKYPKENYNGNAFSTYGYGEINGLPECTIISAFEKTKATLLSIEEFIHLSKEIEEFPEEYIVKCSSKEETNKVCKYINPEYCNNYNFGHWNYVIKKQDYKDQFNIFQTIPSELSSLKVFKFSAWKQLTQQQNNKEQKSMETKEIEKPYSSVYEITLEMLITHPYFRTLSEQELSKIIDSVDYKSIYIQLEGHYPMGKAKNLINKWKMEKEIIGYKLIKPEYEEATLKILGVPWGTPKCDVTSERCIKLLKEAGVLDLWFTPIYKKEEEFKVGDIVKIVKSCPSSSNKDGDIGEITELSNHLLNGFASSVNTALINGWWEATSSLKLLSSEEIKEYENNLLLEEAKKRYPIGTRFVAAHTPTHKEQVSIITNSNFEIFKCKQGKDFTIYNRTDDKRFYALSSESKYGNTCHDRVVYADGVWAEILLSSPQITINTYTGEFFDNYVKFGCAEIDKQLFINLHQTAKINWSINGNKNIESVAIGKGTFSKEQIKEIAEYYLNKV